ncbi:MAG: ribonuclease HII [Coriobacteriaceae bacterium]|nr:ribonuclease HII [Coriobacteriaceae bacterium]
MSDGDPSVREVRTLFEGALAERTRALVERFRTDTRSGVVACVAAAERRLERADAEVLRIEGLLAMETSLRAAGFTAIAGIDEVGRGALAGPVTAAAVVLRSGVCLDGLDDSKRLTPEARLRVRERLLVACVASCVAHAWPDEIDSLGIGAATRNAMRRALEGLGLAVDHVIVDGLPLRLHPAETAVVGGDAKVACVAAASVLAKVERDALMCSLSREHPHWGFERHKGYGSADHLSAIAEAGLSPIHRRSFAPCGGTGRLFDG